MNTAKSFQSWPTSFFTPWQQSMHYPFEPLLELNEITMRFYNEISKENTRAINEMMQNNSEMIQTLTHSKDINDILNAQRN